MTKQGVNIWSNVVYDKPDIEYLRDGLAQRGCELTMSDGKTGLAGFPVVFGQPAAESILETPSINLVQLDSAGYEKYDTEQFRAAMKDAGVIMTNSSSVYDEPCAQHIVSMILSLARRLPAAGESQRNRSWPMMKLRAESCLLNDQTVVILGFGAIAKRLVELLKPFHMNISALRRNLKGDETAPVFQEPELEARLSTADHVINILPSNPSTRGFVTDKLFSSIKKGAIFYNIGRGVTIDQDALIKNLENGRVAAAFLDVTNPEPLPPGHPLWDAPNCYITPHTAGGHIAERPRLIRHFLDNLDAFLAGKDLKDRII